MGWAGGQRWALFQSGPEATTSVGRQVEPAPNAELPPALFRRFLHTLKVHL